MPSTKEVDLKILFQLLNHYSIGFGDAIAISCMRHKNFNKLDFKKFHPSGTLSVKLKTAGDLMSTGKKMPLVKENTKMSKALKIINKKIRSCYCY